MPNAQSTIDPFAAVPDDLKSRRQWVMHKSKRPVQPNGAAASSTDPATWSTFDDALAAFNAGGFSGVGFVFSKDDSFCGVDLDACRDSTTGQVAEWAAGIVNDLATYAEVSPSGTGIHAICKGEIPGDGSGRKAEYESGKVEVYAHSRFFCVTGDVADLAPRPVRECSPELAALWQKAFGAASTVAVAEAYDDPPTVATPAEIADCCREVLALPRAVSGEGGSDATIHAACLIRRWGVYGDEGRKLFDLFNEHRCDPPWSESELSRKWEAARRHQLPRGWEFEAIEGGDDAAPVAPAADKAKGFNLSLMQWSDFQAADFPQRYLIPGLVVEGEHLIIGGRTKGLKTMVSLDMMISLASGQPFLGHFPVADRCPVAFLSGESGKATLQRAAAAMALARGAKISDDRFFIGFDLPRLSNASHLDAVAAAVRQYGIKLFCIDPAYLATLNASNTDKASNQFAMGLILEPFGHIGAETGCTMALVHHARKPGKAEAYKPMTRDDLTQSGFDAWMRQWVLLSRRSPFKRGLHELHMGVGGSAGHNGEWHVDVDEGQPADELVGRRWEVTVAEVDAVDNERQADQVVLDADTGFAAILAAPNRELSRREFCTKIQAGAEKGGRADRAIAHLEASGRVLVQERNGRGGKAKMIVAAERIVA